MKKSTEDRLAEIKNCLTGRESLYVIPESEVARFEAQSREGGKSTIPIMTYGEYTVYLQADCENLPKIPLTKFNYTSGTFEKKWGPAHRTIVLTPNHSSIRKVELSIQGMDIRKMRLLPDKTGDVIEDMAKIRIVRHYRFSHGTVENKSDTRSASPGETNARRDITG